MRALVAALISVSVPSFGDSFFIWKHEKCTERKIRCRFPSPHSGILFLFETHIHFMRLIAKKVSVPSFGDSFFIRSSLSTIHLIRTRFPSPHSGILFLYLQPGTLVIVRVEEAFPSPHSGILFLCWDVGNLFTNNSKIVSVPSFGDSFFITAD